MKKYILLFFVYHLFFICSCSHENESQALLPPAQQTEVNLDFKNETKVYKLAILDGQNAEPYSSARVELLKVLKEHGLIEGKNLKIFYRNVENNSQKSLEALKEAVSKNFHIIITNGTVPTIAAKKLYFKKSGLRFIYICVTDPVGVGVIKDFGIPPMANFTGISYPVPIKSRFNFIKDIMPGVNKLGLIYAQMPQSVSYRKWVENLIKKDKDFSHIKIVFRSIPLITGEGGCQKMSDAAIKYIKELNSKVDAFVSPNDQMGVGKYFSQNVWKYGGKPLIGLGLKDVTSGWGATASIYPSHKSMGSQSAVMIMKLLRNVKIKSIPAEWPKKNGFAFDLNKANKFNIDIPVKLIELAEKNIIK
jgi:putative ABC transport system substrate-binding protein